MGLWYPDKSTPLSLRHVVEEAQKSVGPRTIQRYPTKIAMELARPDGVAQNGEACFVIAENGYYVRASGAWKRLWEDSLLPFTGTSPAFNIGGLRSHRSGPWVVLNGVALASAAYTLAGGATGVGMGTVQHAPASQQIQRVTSQLGDLEVVVTGAGAVTARNLQASMTFGSGNYISFDGVTYRGA